MNKSESKYFNTARKMDEAFLELLEHKDFAYITVKEICGKAEVNRSTFYLHYETIEDLLEESIQLVFDRFLAHMKMDQEGIIQSIYDCPIEQLNLVTPEYLTPYLSYIRENKRLFRTAVEKATVLRMDEAYRRMFAHVFTPILERFHVPEAERGYMMAFYINGLMAVLTEGLKADCADSIEDLIDVIIRLVRSNKK